MRFLLLLLAVAPTVAAQGSSFEMEPMPAEPIMPLTELVRRWSADLACPAGLPTDPPAEFHVWVSQAPGWARVQFEPDAVVLDKCSAGRQLAAGVMKVVLDETAPAMASGQLEFSYSYQDELGENATARSALPLVPAYYSIVDVRASETIAIARPGGNHTFLLTISNHGNGATRFAVEVANAAEGLRVEPIEPFTLEGRQGPRNVSERDVPIVVQAARTVGYQNEVGVVNLRITGASALDGAPGDASVVSLLLTTRGFATPAPAALVLVAAALALAARRTKKKR